MKHPIFVTTLMISMSAVILVLISSAAQGAIQVVENTTVSVVSVNGGADSTNPGTTCLSITSNVSQACPGGFVAIMNNNRQLIATALEVKAADRKITLYYDDAAPPQHCPWLVFTPCVVSSIMLR
jgi:hypothetical protein